MERNERYLARLIFKTKIYESDKQNFEDLFTKVMGSSESAFLQVKPQGSYGDGKCDGFNATTGEYYQVYAPEDLKGNEDTANSKMEKSLTGIMETWKKSGFSVNKCYFVVNDKFRHVYASAYKNAKTLGDKFKVECEIFTCKNLEDIFLKLDEEQIINIIGIIPDPLNINTVEFSVMAEVISYLLKSKAVKETEKIPANPDFERKIVFNSLSDAIAGFLNAGQRQRFAINEYFELNSKFTKEDLRQIFSTIYKEALAEIPESETKSDEVFQYIVEKSSPQDNFAVHTAVYVLMAYYFEYCDIFETPNI